MIHMTWKSYDLPQEYEENVKAWRKMHPNLVVKIYNDNDLRNEVIRAFPQLVQAYDSFPKMINRVDFARYAILYTHGGIYADMDTMPLKNFDPLLRLNTVVLGCEPQEHSVLYDQKTQEKVLCNAIMISPKGHPLWPSLSKFIVDTFDSQGRGDVVYQTGPMALTRFYEQDPKNFKDVKIFDSCLFFPLVDSSNKNIDQTRTTTQTEKFSGKTFHNISQGCNINDSYAVHTWGHSWLGSSGDYVKKILIITFVLFVIVMILKKRKR